MPMQLYYTHNLNPRVAVAVARHLGASVDFVRADPMGRDQEALRPLNPNTLAPILVEDGHSLWETDAIACRLAALQSGDFWPAGQLVEMLRWLSWSAHHLTRAGGALIFEYVTKPTFSTDPPDARTLSDAHDDFLRHAAVLDRVLATRDWLVDDRLTYADFRVATSLPFATAAHLPLEGFSHIRRWHDRLLHLDAWREPFAGLA